MRRFGATVPPNGIARFPIGNRYCVHEVNCHDYQRSVDAGNTIGFETSDINEMRKYLEALEELEGGIQPCKKCSDGCTNFN